MDRGKRWKTCYLGGWGRSWVANEGSYKQQQGLLLQKSGHLVPTAGPQGDWPGHTLATLDCCPSGCISDPITLAQLFFSCVMGDGTRQFLPLFGPISWDSPWLQEGRKHPSILESLCVGLPHETSHGFSPSKKGSDLTLGYLAATLRGQNQLPIWNKSSNHEEL